MDSNRWDSIIKDVLHGLKSFREETGISLRDLIVFASVLSAWLWKQKISKRFGRRKAPPRSLVKKQRIPVFLSITASEDISKIFDSYEGKTPGLGKEFIQCISDVVDEISRRPVRFKTAFEDLRAYSVAKFPYTVWFKVEREKQTSKGYSNRARETACIIATLQDSSRLPA